MLRPEGAESKETNQTKHTPYLIHKTELWGVYCEHFGETWYYNAIALYFGGASVKLCDMVIHFYGGIFVIFMKSFLSVKYFFSVWPVIISLHWAGMAIDCDDKKLKTCCRGVPPKKFGNKKTHLKDLHPTTEDFPEPPVTPGRGWCGKPVIEDHRGAAAHVGPWHGH